jgi:hypothetical protein
MRLGLRLRSNTTLAPTVVVKNDRDGNLAGKIETFLKR